VLCVPSVNGLDLIEGQHPGVLGQPGPADITETQRPDTLPGDTGMAQTPRNSLPPLPVFESARSYLFAGEGDQGSPPRLMSTEFVAISRQNTIIDMS
jgi:hypothetical protein